MGRRVGFYKSWMDLKGGDLGAHDMDAFNTGMSVRQKTLWSVYLLILVVAVFVFLEPFAAALIGAVGAWVIWNTNNRITKLEKKIFLTALDLSIFFALVSKASVFLNATGLLLVMMIVHLVYVWRR